MRHNGLCRALVGCCLAVAQSVSAAPDIDTLIDALEAVRRDSKVPAFALTLVDTDQVLHASAHGIADQQGGRPADADTRFRIGSVTKTFTALAIQLAAADALLTLDTPLTEITGPDVIHNPWSTTTPVTIAHLLEHTAGLTDLTYAEMYHSDPAPLPLAAAVQEFAGNRRVRWQPGVHYSYSNAGAGLAAYALEKLTGTSYEEFIRKRVFAPLAMRNASVTLDKPTRRTLASGYDRDGVTRIPYWHMLFRPFGAINMTAADMAGPLRMLLNQGSIDGAQFLAPQAIARMETPKTTLAARRGLEFGYGAGLYSWYHGGHHFFGHGGDGDGYLAQMGYSRAAGFGYCVVINVFNHEHLSKMRRLIEDFIVARSMPPATQTEHLGLPADASFLGAYRAATFRFGDAPKRNEVALQIHLNNTQIFTTLTGGAPQQLIYLGGNLWRRFDEPGATIAVVRNSDGQWVFQGERESFIQISEP